MDLGSDVVDDGEFGKTLWMWYVRDRLDGIGSRDWSEADEAYLKGRDIENLREATAGQDVTEVFMPVVAPASIEDGLGNEHYESREDLMRALADAICEEYKAVIDAGFLLQVDDAWVPAQWDRRPSCHSRSTCATRRRASTCSTMRLTEHPELVAERITRVADRVGRENVIAGADCGFGSRIHPQLGWAKLQVLAGCGPRLAPALATLTGLHRGSVGAVGDTFPSVGT